MPAVKSNIYFYCGINSIDDAGFWCTHAHATCDHW